MGLDMYLKGRRYLSAYNEADQSVRDGVRERMPELAAAAWSENPVQEVSAEVGYWRKANQIHRWFVEQVQGGEDECRPHSVSREQLMQLREACVTVLADPKQAESLLPTGAGFFFGSTEYDQYYQQDLESTVAIIDRALALPESWDFEYQSSW